MVNVLEASDQNAGDLQVERTPKCAMGATGLWHTLLGDICSHSNLADSVIFLDIVHHIWLA